MNEENTKQERIKHMKPKDSRKLEERALDLQKVLTWCIIHNVKKHYKTLDNFKKTCSLIKSGRATSKQQVDFCRRFGFDSNQTIRKVLGKADGKWVKLSDIKPYLDKWIHYRRSNTKHYNKTGKSFAVHSYWYIDFDVISRWLDCSDVADCRSRFYTKEQYHLINKLFLNHKKEVKRKKNQKAEDGTVTRAREEQIRQECAEGKHSVDADYLIKQEKKRERAEEKRKISIAKKAVKATMSEYAKIIAENESLKHEIEKLKG